MTKEEAARKQGFWGYPEADHDLDVFFKGWDARDEEIGRLREGIYNRIQILRENGYDETADDLESLVSQGRDK